MAGTACVYIHHVERNVRGLAAFDRHAQVFAYAQFAIGEAIDIQAKGLFCLGCVRRLAGAVGTELLFDLSE